MHHLRAHVDMECPGNHELCHAVRRGTEVPFKTMPAVGAAETMVRAQASGVPVAHARPPVSFACLPASADSSAWS